MTQKAKTQLARTHYTPENNPAICALVEFASQNSGLEPGNYGFDTNGRRAMRQEQRSISADWKRFKDALMVANAEGVKDADVIAEAPHAFSGRLEWVIKSCNASTQPCADCGAKPKAEHAAACKGGDHRLSAYWNYTTGQYFPTEYRKAAAALLDYAIRKVRQNRPAQAEKITSIAQLEDLNARNGKCFFDKGTMRFFSSKIESGIIKGKYFITSECPPHGSRKYSLRSFDDKGSIDTIGEFCSYSTKAEAVASIPE